MAESPESTMQLKTLVLGPWVIGGFADLLLQGILYPMFITYFTSYKDDLLLIKLVVGGLAILTTLKSVQVCAVIWIQHVIYFDDLQGALLLAYTKWWATGSSLMVAIIGLYVQTFFLNRLRLLSNSWLVVIPIGLILVFAFVAIVVATICITYQVNEPIALWFALHLSAVFAGDLLITSSMAYFLIKTERSVLPRARTVGVIQSLLRLTFLTAAPAAFCAMINLILSQSYPGTKNLMSNAFNISLAKLYALSMMYTLNARQKIRFGSGRSQDLSGSRVISVLRPTNCADVERSLTNGISVHTETHNHIDMRTGFNHGASDDKKSKNETFFEAK